MTTEAWTPSIDNRKRFDPSTGERKSDMILCYVMNGRECIALVHGQDETIAARTHLLAAAPEMLAALKAAEVELVMADKPGSEQVIRIVMAAIARAEGLGE